MNFPEGDESESPRLREPNEVRQPSAGCPVGVSTAKQTSYLGSRQEKRTNPDGVVSLARFNPFRVGIWFPIYPG